MEDVPKALGPDDTIEYRLYPTECGREFLTRLAVECTHVAKTIVVGHIWHYEPFRLVVWPEDKGTHPHIFGTTCYHDNIEDEWLIVHLLFALSKQYDLVVSVTDSDGQFLLIETAHHLPKWLKPETSANRVFIRGGSLHIIPKPRTPAEVSLLPVATPTLKEAIQLVRGEFPTEASAAIQEAIQKRISCCPVMLQTSLHRAHCYLPCPVAHVMSHDPQVVAAAVHALCERDPNDMKACRQLEYFSPARHTSVMVEVVFTRCLYAQLLHQRFSPPRHSGFKLPPHGSKPYDLGMKLTCGLEILLARVGGVSVGEGRRSDVTSDPRWNKFVGSLKERGYFQNEIEGSKLYCQLLETAKEYFTANMTTHNQDDSRDPLVSAGKRIAHILQTIPSNDEEIKEQWKDLQPPDNDSWLEITPRQLDEMMQRHAGYAPEEQGDSAELDLESMVFGMKSFVEKVSTHKGAEFPWSVDDSTAVRFEPDKFLETVQAMLDGKVREGGEEEGSGTSDSDLESSSDGEEIATIMQQMDKELVATEIGKSFEKVKLLEPEPADETPQEEHNAELRPVDVDFNLVKNLLDSYSSQQGLAGPASNILNSMGVKIPDDTEQQADTR